MADGRYDYIETGSLISIRQNVKGILIPSEEEEMILNPLDYEEFQWALGNKVSIPIMRKLFESNKGIGDAGARGEMRNLGYICLSAVCTGVRTYLETNNMEG